MSDMEKWDQVGPVFLLARGNRQALAPFGPAALEDNAAILGAHPHDEPVGARSTAAIRLKRTLHLTPGRVSGTQKKLGS